MWSKECDGPQGWIWRYSREPRFEIWEFIETRVMALWVIGFCTSGDNIYQKRCAHLRYLRSCV